MLVSSAAAIRLSLQPSPASDTSAFKTAISFPAANHLHRCRQEIRGQAALAFCCQ
jgi:hypothetical protein